MSTRIIVRLPDDLVAFVDGLVADGVEESRSAVVVKALTREQRRVLAERDVEILMREGEDEDMLAMARHLARQPMDID